MFFKNLLSEIQDSKKRIKQFSRLFAFIGLILIPGFLFYKEAALFFDKPVLILSIVLGLFFLFVGELRYLWLKPLYQAWMLLALSLGFIMTRVIISIVFFLVMWPIGWLKRKHFRSVLRLDFKENPKTYWIKRDWDAKPERLEKQY